MATVKLLKPTTVTDEYGEIKVKTYYDLGHSELAFVTMKNLSNEVSTFTTTGGKSGVVYPAGFEGYAGGVITSEKIPFTKEKMLEQHLFALHSAVNQIDLALKHFSKWFPMDATKSPYDLGHPEELQCLMCSGSGGWPGGVTGWVACKPCNKTGLA